MGEEARWVPPMAIWVIIRYAWTWRPTQTGHQIPSTVLNITISRWDEHQLLEYHFPVPEEGAERIVTRPIRNDSSGELDPNLSSFNVHSGVLLFGQLHSIFNASN